MITVEFRARCLGDENFTWAQLLPFDEEEFIERKQATQKAAFYANAFKRDIHWRIKGDPDPNNFWLVGPSLR